MTHFIKNKNICRNNSYFETTSNRKVHCEKCPLIKILQCHPQHIYQYVTKLFMSLFQEGISMTTELPKLFFNS